MLLFKSPMTNEWHMQKNKNHLILMKLFLKTLNICIRKQKQLAKAFQTLLINKKISKVCHKSLFLRLLATGRIIDLLWFNDNFSSGGTRETGELDMDKDKVMTVK